MKLHADRMDGQNAIARFGPDGVVVNGREFRHSVLIPAAGDPQAWPVPNFAGLTEAHFEAIAALSPELVIFGSGAKLRFPHPSLTRALIKQRIGLETMDTAAACRTHNVLLAEGRAVVAALLFEEA